MDRCRSEDHQTHQRVLSAEQLFALFRQDEPAHTDFPRSGPALRDLGAQRSSHDLVSPAHTDEPDPILREHLVNEIQRPYDPGVVIESVEACGRARSISPLSPCPTIVIIVLSPKIALTPIDHSQAKRQRSPHTTPRDQHRIYVFHLRTSLRPFEVEFAAHVLFLALFRPVSVHDIPACNL